MYPVQKAADGEVYTYTGRSSVADTNNIGLPAV